MRLPGFFPLILLGFYLLLSCKKEYSLEDAVTGISIGSLKTEAGDCMPSGSNGVFKKSNPVDSSHYIYVDIDVFTTGSYRIKSDTVNGVYFNGEGLFDSTGIHTVKLNAAGTPFTNGTVPYHVQFGKQRCIVNIFTTGP